MGMTKEMWQEKVDQFNARPLFSRYVALCQLDRWLEQKEVQKEIEVAAGKDYRLAVVSGDIAVVESTKEQYHADGMGFMVVVFNADKQKWMATHALFPSLHTALLHAIAVVHEERTDTCFAHYAARMLGMGDMG